MLEELPYLEVVNMEEVPNDAIPMVVDLLEDQQEPGNAHLTKVSL